MLTCHKYSIIHPIFACIHCILTVFTLMETIKLIIYVVGVTQDWFLGYIAKDYMHMSTNSTINAVLDVYWNTVLGWMSVVLLYLLIFNVFICFIISYLLGKYGVVFFILAYVLGKFVPL
uniref:Uncharacterized protein n=1 Tax=Acrobeloides nanus TaxID=290746 RepID=A0A914E4L2_9BILA